MKKMEFYTLIAERNAAGCAKLKVNGYAYDEDIGIYQENGIWCAIDLKTGTQINGVALTRAEAVEQIDKALPKLKKVEKDVGYEWAVRRFDKAPIKGGKNVFN